MSILIHGMKMPPRGKVNLLVMFDDGIVQDNSDGQNQWRAIEVPPHGRLIDADALNDLLINLADNEYTPKVFASWLSYEENAPTIIPADPEGGADG